MTFHLQRTPAASAACERVVWGDAASEQLLLLHGRGRIRYCSSAQQMSGHAFRLIMHEYGPRARGATHVERAWAAAAFMPSESPRVYFALEHSSQLLCCDLPLEELHVAQVPVIAVGAAAHASSICAIDCTADFVAVGYEDGSIGYWSPAASTGAHASTATMTLKRHAHEGRVVALSALQRLSADFSLAVLASASAYGALRLWDLLTDQPLLGLAPFGAPAAILRATLLARLPDVAAPADAHGEVAVCCATAGGALALHVLRETAEALEATTCVLEPPAELEGAARVVHLAFSDDGRFGAALYAHADGGGGEVLRVFVGAEPRVARMWSMAEAGDAAVVSCGWGAAEPGEAWRCALRAVLSDGRALHWRVALRGHLLLVEALAHDARARLSDAVRLAALERGRVAEIPTTDEFDGRADPNASRAPRRSLSDARRLPAAPASGRPSAAHSVVSHTSNAPRSLPLTARGSTASYAHADDAGDADADADAHSGTHLPLPRARALETEPSASSASKRASSLADDGWRAARGVDEAALAPRAHLRGAEAEPRHARGAPFAALRAPAPLAPAAAANALARPVEHTMTLLDSELAQLHEALALEAEMPAQLQPQPQPAHAVGHAPKSAMVLNMAKGERRFKALPKLHDGTDARPAGAHPQPARRKSPARSAPPHLSDPLFTADRELEVRSTEYLPPQERITCEPAGHHALLSRSLLLLAVESPAFGFYEGAISCFDARVRM